MIRFHLNRPAACVAAVLASGAVALAALPASAQQAVAPATAEPSTAAPLTTPPEKPPVSGGVRGTFGPWSVVCDTPPGAKFEQCAMMQNVISQDRPDIGLSVVVLKAADGKSRILRVLAPLGVLLPNGLGLYVDNSDKGRAYFVRCFSDGCYAEVVLEDTLIAELGKAKTAIFTLFQTPEEGIGIPVDLTDFANAYAALP
ncbi:MAG: invasion associated locus B family protein [Rhizobiaceae bacterium]|jgi:invasion protein IalB|nr:invasion associated locus B family protein [Rhizobiaceae bacterium]